MRWLAGIVFTVLLVSVFFYKLPVHNDDNSKDASTRLAGNKIQIEAGKFVTINNIPELNPLPEGDFAILFWFNMKNKLANGSKTAIIEKYDQQSENKPGWAVRVSNNKKIYRPEVYWRNPGGKGRWYSFSEFSFKEDRWFGLLLSYKQGKYLGLKALPLEKGKKTETVNLGGYYLPGIFPTSSANVKIGSVGGDLFSGTIGKVYAGPGLLTKEWQLKISEQCLKKDKLETFCLVR